MRQERFARLVRRLEDDAREHPRWYRLRVALLASIGYAYVWTVLVAVLAVLAWLVVAVASGELSGGLIKLILLFGFLALVIVRALWVPFEPPTGVAATPDDAPDLFALIERLRAGVAAPPFHDIVLTDDFNAAVVQTPRLGPLGWYRNTLVLGLPLLAALDRAEFDAVLAHEIGHLSRAHGRFGSWIYRVRATWGRLTDVLDEQRLWGRWAFEFFLRAWAPYFAAYSLVLARDQEYEADQFAARQAGAGALGRALAKLEVLSAHLDAAVWPTVYRQAERSPDPPPAVVDRIVDAVRVGPEASQAARSLASALARPTGVDDTHPGLADRLRALGVQAGAVSPAADPALARYFGGRAAACAGAVAEAWHDMAKEAWPRIHEHLRGLRTRLRELETAAAAGPLDVHRAWERAELTLELEGDGPAEPLLHDVLRLDPDHGGAAFQAGRLLLERDDPSGVALLERAVERDTAVRAEGYALLLDFLRRSGRAAEAAAVEQRAWAHGDALDAASGERQAVSGSDRFEPHALPSDFVTRVVAAVAAVPDVREAYLVRKVVRHLPEIPFHVLGIRLHDRWYQMRSDDGKQAVVQRVLETAPFPGDAYVVVLDDHARAIARKMKRVPGARIFAR